MASLLQGLGDLPLASCRALAGKVLAEGGAVPGVHTVGGRQYPLWTVYTEYPPPGARPVRIVAAEQEKAPPE